VIALLLQMLGLAMIPSAIVAAIYHEKAMLFIFQGIAVVLIFIGAAMWKFIKPSQVMFKIRDGILVVFACWIISGLVGSLPYIFSGCAGCVVNAIFESFSGITTTGATTISDVEVLPKSILFWRAFSQWFGGFGVVLIPIAVLPRLGLEGSVIVRAEMSGTRVNRVAPKLSDTARRMFLIFTFWTLLETVMLLLGGLNFFDALTHSFTTMSTGGFTNYNDNLGHFGNIYVYCVFSFFMLVAGIDVTTQAKLFAGKIGEMIRDTELKYYFVFFGGSTLLIVVYLTVGGFAPASFRTVASSAFHVLATLSTAGFYSAEFDLWPLFPKMILLFLMFIGGCISSTAGGIKVFRVMIFLKMIKRGIRARLHPNAVLDMNVGNHKINSSIASAVTGFIMMYVGLVALGTFVLTLSGIENPSAFVSVLACIGNIGPALSIGGSNLTYDLFSAPIKLFLCLYMLAGRLELTAVVLMFSRHFWNPDLSR
ncbi:MAG: TrkH family potassium uptake protein, partial [Firmicutes bacterium]|nr:TrkH family potassium uptake protein [Bacillota bacterium]